MHSKVHGQGGEIVGVGADLLSRGINPSTISANGLNYSVRNGKRWDPVAISTNNSLHLHWADAFALMEKPSFGLFMTKNWRTGSVWGIAQAIYVTYTWRDNENLLLQRIDASIVATGVQS